MTLFHTQPGVTSYGHKLGILQIDCNQPFIPGDVGNAQTWDFPVLYKVVKGCTIERLILEHDPGLADHVVEAARELEQQGVQAITSNCGFMIRFQKQVAEALNIPVFLSSLLELPQMTATLGPQGKIGVVTAAGDSLSDDDCKKAGISSKAPVHIYGLDSYEAFKKPFLKDCGYLDIPAMEEACQDLARKMIGDHPDMKAILLECATLPPYADIFRNITKLPVFSFYTLIKHWVRSM